jgi:hypothetical protein
MARTLGNWPAGKIKWTWDESFHRAGFDSGGNAIPEAIEEVLRAAGCANVAYAYGGSRHNHHIRSLTLPDGAGELTFDGRTVNPTTALPKTIVDSLSAQFGAPSETLWLDE